MNPRTQQFWDRHAKTYEQTERKFDPIFKHALAITKEHIHPNDHVLDFGCATGSKTLDLALVSNYVHGLDYSPEMVKEANRKKNTTNIKNCSFTQGTIFTPEFSPASFDKIVSFGVLHLLEDAGKEIRRINELLKPGGLFISTTPALKAKMDLKTWLEFSAYLLIRRLGLFPLHLNRLTTSDVEAMIKVHNFNILESRELFHGIAVSFVIAQKVGQSAD